MAYRKPTRVNFNQFEAIDYYFDKLKMGSINFSDIRKQLITEHIDENDIQYVVHQVDNLMQQYELAKIEKAKGWRYYFMGWLLFLLGLGATLYSYLHSYTHYYIFFGAIMSGIPLIFEGKSMMNATKRVNNRGGNRIRIRRK